MRIVNQLSSLSGITHKTKGIVLKTVKYGETSLIVTIYTELFGLQSYLVNGVRASTKKSGMANVFYPAAIIDLVVYYNEFKQLNRIKEARWSYMYQNTFHHVIKNGIALYMVELMSKCVREPENNTDLFAFAEDSLMHLDTADNSTMANYPVFFALQLTNFFGFAPRIKYNSALDNTHMVFDLQEGLLTDEQPIHNMYLENKYAIHMVELMHVRKPAELNEIPMNVQTRRKILDALEVYFSLHMQDFGKLKTLPVLREIMQ